MACVRSRSKSSNNELGTLPHEHSVKTTLVTFCLTELTTATGTSHHHTVCATNESVVAPLLCRIFCCANKI